MNRSLIVLLILISLVSINVVAISSADLDLVQLGDGCGGSDTAATCDSVSRCGWECDPTNPTTRKFVCYEAHGWCDSGAGDGSCVACDFVPIDGEGFTCDTQTVNIENEIVNSDGAIVDTEANEEVLGSRYCVASENPAITPNYENYSVAIIECEDGEYKFLDRETKKDENSCSVDGNVNTQWVYDYDGDGYYSFVETTETTIPPPAAGIIRLFAIPPPGLGEPTVDQGVEVIGSYIVEDSKFWRRFGSGLNWEEGCEEYIADFNNREAYVTCILSSTDSKNTPDTPHCLDTDEDGFGTICEPAEELSISELYNGQYVPLHKLESSATDCDDTDPSIKENFYVKNTDLDYHYGEVRKECGGTENSEWSVLENIPYDDEYDCNDDRDDKNEPNGVSKEGCYCDAATVGRFLESGEVCVDVLSEEPVGITTQTSYILKRVASQYQWIDVTTKEDPFNIPRSFCPKTMCPYEDNNDEKCATIGQYWGQIAANKPTLTAGDLVCEPDFEGNAQWTSRTAKAMAALTLVAEQADEDYSIYCDSIPGLLQNNNVAAGETTLLSGSNLGPGGIHGYIKDLNSISLVDDEAIRGCMLALNGGNNRDYIQNLLFPESFEQDDQRLIYAFPISKKLDDTKFYFGTDVDDRYETTDWLIGAGDSIRFHKESRILFVLQGESGTVLNNLGNDFSSTFSSNEFFVNVISFFKSPLTYLIDKTNFYSATNFPEVIKTVHQFDAAFLGKNQETYVFTTIDTTFEGTKFIGRITNPDFTSNSENGFKDFLATTCSDPMNEYAITCGSEQQGIIGTYPHEQIGNDILLTSNAFNTNDWAKWSTALRLQNNTKTGANFFADIECTVDADCNNNDDACVIEQCIAGICLEEFDDSCILSPTDPEAEGERTFAVCNDGEDNDGDGKTDYPEDIGCSSIVDTTEENEDFNAIVRDEACLPDEKVFLELSSLTNAHVQLPTGVAATTYRYKVCIPNTFSVTQEASTTCSAGEHVISLTDYANAHGALSENAITGTIAVCLEPSLGTLTCTTQTSCAPQNSVIALSTQSNAHVEDPDSQNNYNFNICCQIN